MDQTKRRVRKAAIPYAECVACGCCAAACPLGAIEMIKGMYSTVDVHKCVGCGRCVNGCPAGIIFVTEVTA